MQYNLQNGFCIQTAVNAGENLFVTRKRYSRITISLMVSVFSIFLVLLRDFFDVLYDEDVISEDAFYHWEQSSDPAEQAGKGVARTSVVQFFAWLREADEESQEDN